MFIDVRMAYHNQRLNLDVPILGERIVTFSSVVWREGDFIVIVTEARFVLLSNFVEKAKKKKF